MNRKIAIMQEHETPGTVPLREHDHLTARREQQLARLIHEHSDPLARQELIEASLPLVYHIARRYEHSGMSLEDLIAEGNLGLIQAVERFDPDCGTRFHTYARWWIREAIHHAITQYGRMIRVPEYLTRRLRAWSRRCSELQHTMHRRPVDEEICDELGFSKRQTMGVLTGLRISTAGNPASLEHQSCPPETNNAKQREQTIVHDLLGHLNPPLRNVLELRYGLSECDSLPRTIRQTADMLNLSAQDIRRMERDALRSLRRIVQRLHKKRTSKAHRS